MPMVRIRPKYQITIPKELSEKLHLEVGDLVEAVAKNGNIILVPKQLTDKQAIPRLSAKEQKLLMKAKEKINKINTDMIHSKGLNNEEIKVSIKAGLIDEDQAYWWHEDWQKGEREAEKSIKAGEGIGPFNNAKDAIEALKNAKV